MDDDGGYDLNDQSPATLKKLRAKRRRCTRFGRWFPAFVAGCLTTVGILIVVIFLSIIASLPGGEQFDDPAEYDAAQMAMYGIYGTHARFLPVEIPANATHATLEATTTNFLQGKPYIFLSYVLPPNEALAEIDRLRALGPVTETAGKSRHESEFSRNQWTGVTLDRSGCYLFEFGDVTELLTADAVIDPTNGDVLFRITSN